MINKEEWVKIQIEKLKTLSSEDDFEDIEDIISNREKIYMNIILLENILEEVYKYKKKK